MKNPHAPKQRALLLGLVLVLGSLSAARVAELAAKTLDPVELPTTPILLHCVNPTSLMLRNYRADPSVRRSPGGGIYQVQLCRSA